MDQISISEFKATCIAVIDEVLSTGQAVTVTRRGKPICQVVPPPMPRKKPLFGSVKGCQVGDVLTPLPIEDWGRLG